MCATAGAASARSRRAFGVRTWITLASLAAAVPVLLLSLALTHALAERHEAAVYEQLKRQAESAAAQVLMQVDTAPTQLRAMAMSNEAEEGDVARLYTFALRIKAALPHATALSLSTADGALVFSTLRPLGDPLQISPAAAYETAVFERGASVVTPLFTGTVSGRPIIGVTEPVRVRGQLRYALRANLLASAFSASLQAQGLPASWTASVVDQNHVILARSREPERFVGTLATDSLREMLRTAQFDRIHSVTKDGTPVVAQVVPVGDTGWHLAIGVPESELRKEWLWPLLLQVLVGVVCLALGLWLARSIARLVQSQMQRMAPAAKGPVPPPGPVLEVNLALDAQRQLARREEALRERLAEAAVDPLTGLVNRAAFGESVRRLADALDPALERLAVLYLDLDGFKPINDRLGHAAGDRVLADVGAVIRVVLRPQDLAARWGGDEFVVCLRLHEPQAEATAIVIAERLIEQVRSLESDLSCSVGVALGGRACELDALIAAADAAMLRAKRSGKGHVEVAAGAMR